LFIRENNQNELLFKQIKQNFTLNFFIIENENTIKIEPYYALIVKLLTAFIRKNNHRWAF